MLKCSVVGATGYTGAELVRLLAGHPAVKLVYLTTRSDEKIQAKTLVPSLGKHQNLVIENRNWKEVSRDSDCVFLALPHTTAMEAAAQFHKDGKIVIDLSADFRLRNSKIFEAWYETEHSEPKLLQKAVYGLPEIYRAKIREANLIANPGCYPTGAILGLVPLLKEKLIDPASIVIDAKSGVSGAGKKLSLSTHFAEVNENFNAYKMNRHQHMPEIEQALTDVNHKQVDITFVPHLLPITRGIFSTIYVKKRKGIKAAQIAKAFESYYRVEPFVRFLGEGISPSTRGVQHTNFCDIGIRTNTASDQVIVMTAIDNLVKGASGQAVQNMNIRAGFPEDAGLL